MTKDSGLLFASGFGLPRHGVLESVLFFSAAWDAVFASEAIC